MSEERTNPSKILFPANVEHNNQILNFCRLFISIAAGCACGIMGFTRWTGLLMYVASVLATSALISFKFKFVIEPYFSSRTNLLTASLFQGLLSFVLFWTLAYNMIHVY